MVAFSTRITSTVENLQPLVRTLDQTFNFINKSLKSKCFSKGWGDKSLIIYLEDLATRAQNSPFFDERKEMISSNIDIYVTNEEELKNDGIRIIDAQFKSPVAHLLPDESKMCYIQFILPILQKEPIPLAIQYAMTGDQSFSVRKEIGKNLVKEYNIASLAIMNPFYGQRKPEKQERDAIFHVSDLMMKGVSLVSEGLSLIEYLKENDNFGTFGPFGVTGISMGGHMASMAGINSLDPLVIVPCISPYSAAPVFTEGLLSQWCDWEILEKQLPNYIHSNTSNISSAKDYLNYLLDKTTNLLHYPQPQSVDTVIQVSAKFDCYVPGTGEILQKHWKGSELRWISHSHVSSIALAKSQFEKAIGDAFARFPSK